MQFLKKNNFSAPNSCGASTISEGDIFIYSCSAQLISFEVDSISKEINCAEHEIYEYVPLTYRAGAATGSKLKFFMIRDLSRHAADGQLVFFHERKKKILNH